MPVAEVQRYLTMLYPAREGGERSAFAPEEIDRGGRHRDP
jgi:hypothetical protein